MNCILIVPYIVLYIVYRSPLSWTGEEDPRVTTDIILPSNLDRVRPWDTPLLGQLGCLVLSGVRALAISSERSRLCEMLFR